MWLTRFEELDAPDGSFDLITSNHVIEHVEDPTAFSRKAWLRKPGGVYALRRRTSTVRMRAGSGDGYWGGYHFPRRWHFYTRETLEQMLRAVGLSVVAVAYSPNPVFWNGTVHHILIPRTRSRSLSTAGSLVERRSPSARPSLRRPAPRRSGARRPPATVYQPPAPRSMRTKPGKRATSAPWNWGSVAHEAPSNSVRKILVARRTGRGVPSGSTRSRHRCQCT